MIKLPEIKVSGLDEVDYEKYFKIVLEHIKWAGDFFDWVPPEIIFEFHKTRESIDKHWGNKSYNWVVGFHKENTTEIHLIHPHNYEELSVHKFSAEGFANLLKHEITHLFIGLKYQKYPYLFNEGLALYVSNFYLKDKVLQKVKERNILPEFESLFFFENDYLAASFFSMFLVYLDGKYRAEKVNIFVNQLDHSDYKQVFKDNYECNFDEEYEFNFLKWLLQQ